MAEQYSPQDGEEVMRHFRAEIDALPEPDLTAVEDTEHGPALQLTYDDYRSAPEASFSEIANSSMVAYTEQGTVSWQGKGVYHNSLVAKLTHQSAGPSHILLSGSVYIPPSRAAMLEDVEYSEILSEAKVIQRVTPVLTAKFTPVVFAPGVICKDSLPYYHRASPVEELDFKNSYLVDAAMQQPQRGAFISIEKSAGRVQTYFVFEELFVLPAVTALFRKAGGQNFVRFA